jgi:hypothetical protein
LIRSTFQPGADLVRWACGRSCAVRIRIGGIRIGGIRIGGIRIGRIRGIRIRIASLLVSRVPVFPISPTDRTRLLVGIEPGRHTLQVKGVS